MGAPTEVDMQARILRVDRRTLIIGWAALAWLVGASVWAGETYQRFQSMDSHLEKIDLKLDSVSQIESIRQRTEDNSRRMDKLEDFILQLKEDRR